MLKCVNGYVYSTGMYISTSNDFNTQFLDAMQHFGRRIECTLYLKDSTDTIVETLNSSYINSSRMYIDGDILRSVMRSFEFELSGVYSGDYKTARFMFGVSSDGDTYYRIVFENLVVTETEINLEENTTKLTVYDSMVKAMVPYDINVTVLYPMTNYEYLQLLCSAIGFTMDSSIPSTGVMALTRNIETYSELSTYRDIFDDMSGILGGCLMVEGTKLVFKYPTATNRTITESNLKSFSLKEEYPAVTNVVLSRYPQGDNVAYITGETSGSVIKLVNNEMVEGYQIQGASDRTPYLAPIFNSVSGWGAFMTYEFESYGYILFEPCDIFTLSLNDGRTERCLWTSNDVKIDQGVSEDAETITPLSSETDYTRSTNQSKLERDTYLRVDKVEGEIEALSRRVDQTFGEDGLYPAENLYPSEILYPKRKNGVVLERQMEAYVTLTAEGLQSQVDAIEDNAAHLQTQITQNATDITLQSQISGYINQCINSDFTSKDGYLQYWTVINDSNTTAELADDDDFNPTYKPLKITHTATSQNQYYGAIRQPLAFAENTRLKHIYISFDYKVLFTDETPPRLRVYLYLKYTDGTYFANISAIDISNYIGMKRRAWVRYNLNSEKEIESANMYMAYIPATVNMTVEISRIMVVYMTDDNNPDRNAWNNYAQNNVISMINVNPSGVKIQGEKIDIKGITTFSSSSGGTTVIDGGTVNLTNLNASNITTGTLNAINITGSQITGSNFESSSGAYIARLWGGTYSMKYNDYYKVAIYQSSASSNPGGSGIIKVFSGSTTDVNIDPSDGWTGMFSPASLQNFYGGVRYFSITCTDSGGVEIKNQYTGSYFYMYPNGTFRISDSTGSVQLSSGTDGYLYVKTGGQGAWKVAWKNTSVGWVLGYE